MAKLAVISVDGHVRASRSIYRDYVNAPLSRISTIGHATSTEPLMPGTRAGSCRTRRSGTRELRWRGSGAARSSR